MSQHQRINFIHRELSKRHRLTANSLARELEVSSRTIRRDLEMMRDIHGLPLAFDSEHHTWFYTRDVTNFTLAHTGPQTHLVLLVARQAAEQLKATPLYEELRTAIDNLVNAFPEKVSSEHALLVDKMRFEGPPTAIIDSEIWEEISDGLKLSLTLKMEYRTGMDGKTRQRKVDPYGIVVRNRDWFLVGWDHLSQAVRTFFFPRILKAQSLLDEEFKLRDGFNLDAYLEDSVDAHQSTGPRHTVKLRFTPEGSLGGQDFFWTKKQLTSTDDAGRLLVEFTTGALYAVERHVLSWGGMVEVLSPPELRQRIAAAAASITALHQPEPATKPESKPQPRPKQKRRPKVASAAVTQEAKLPTHTPTRPRSSRPVAQS